MTRLSLRLGLLASLAGLTLAAGCTYMSQGFFTGDERGAIAASDDHFGDSAERIVYPDQNWDNADSLWFYNITQGSDLLPYELFLHLEQADSRELFRSDANMRRYRYLVQHPTRANPDGLPVGWVKDTYQGRDYLGLTCAACHTSQINYQGVGIRIDGGPAMADMGTMLKGLEAALEASLNQPAKFRRLAAKLAPEGGEAQTDWVHDQLMDAHRLIAHYNRTNRPANADRTVHYGYARLDAFGRIFNRVLGHLTPGQTNANPPNAPVSYPFLWDTPQHDFVQWNGVADNAGEGPLGRNTGEVLGVFASMELERRKGEAGYRSSADIRNLARIERHLGDLWSPSWPELAGREILPPIDPQLAERGRELFVEYRCLDCHHDIDRDSPQRRVTAQMASLSHLGTDPQMARNALAYRGRSGYFEGELIDPLAFDGGRFGPTTPVLPALTKATRGVVVNPDPDGNFLIRWIENGYDLVAAIFDNPIKKTHKHVDFTIRVNKNSPAALMAYKGRPLNGIWATAPYLHNGSVPNLYELLLPSCTHAPAGAECRSRQFAVGSLSFDPKRVGFVSKPLDEHPGLFRFDTRLPGNRNTGHEYAAGITPVIVRDENGLPRLDEQGRPVTETLPPMNRRQRWALVEYLKTL